MQFGRSLEPCLNAKMSSSAHYTGTTAASCLSCQQQPHSQLLLVCVFFRGDFAMQSSCIARRLLSLFNSESAWYHLNTFLCLYIVTLSNIMTQGSSGKFGTKQVCENLPKPSDSTGTVYASRVKLLCYYKWLCVVRPQPQTFQQQMNQSEPVRAAGLRQKTPHRQRYHTARTNSLLHMRSS